MIKRVFIFLITLYQLFFPIRGHCRFYPTCSSYTKEAIETYGFPKGLLMGLRRISRCNPFISPTVDFVERGIR